MNLHRSIIPAFFLTVSILINICSLAQKKEQFLDYKLKDCEQSKASYYSITDKTDSGYFRRIFFVNGAKKVQMIALFEDSTCKKINGNAIWYYANGFVQRKVRMLHNMPEGVDVKFHNNGSMSDSGTYHNGKPVGCTYSWHRNGYPADSTARINDSFAVHVSWFDDGQPASAGRELYGKKNGTWVFYHQNGNKSAVEIYDAGKRISIHHFNEDGVEIPVDTSRNEHAAEFSGGVKKWWTYLERSLVWPRGYHFENTNMVALQVELIVDEKGNIGNVFVINPFHPEFDKVAYDVISKSPKWIPAIQHNRSVKYRFLQIVTFAEQ